MLNEYFIIAAGRRVLWSISHMNVWIGFYPEPQLKVTSTVPIVKCLMVTIISPTWNCQQEGQLCCATVQLCACGPDDNCGLFSYSLLMQYTVQTVPVSTKSTSEVTSCEITFRLKAQMCSDICSHHRKFVLLSDVCIWMYLKSSHCSAWTGTLLNTLLWCRRATSWDLSPQFYAPSFELGVLNRFSDYDL